MEYFRKYLIYIRKLDNTEMKPRFIILMLIVSAISLLLGLIADMFLPINFGYNMIRAVIATVAGIASASYYLVVLDRVNRDKHLVNNNYIPFKKRLSYKQRSNISIIIGTFIALFILLSSKASLAFTFKTAFAIFTGIALTAFARKDRSEFLKDVYEIPDLRDLEFMSKKSKKEILNVEENAKKSKKDKRINKMKKR